MKKILLGCFLTALIGGCVTAPENKPRTTISNNPAAQTVVLEDKIIKENGHEIMVISKPSGAKIELNGKFVGFASGKFYVIRKANRYGFLPRMTVTATPPEESKDLYTQTKLFDGYTDTPDIIIFDMTQPPPLPMIDGSS